MQPREPVRIRRFRDDGRSGNRSLPASATHPDEPFRDEWARFGQDPGPLLFLLGCQRSGTTLLHLQLARTGAFRFLSACDIYSANRMVYNERHGLIDTERADFSRLLRDHAQDRGIDAIPAGPDTPEEYGWR